MMVNGSEFPGHIENGGKIMSSEKIKKCNR